MGGRKHSLNLIGPGQGQRPPVFFNTIYIFENHMCIFYVYNMKIQKTVYIELTLVLTQVCPTWATSCRHPNHSSRAIHSHTALVE